VARYEMLIVYNDITMGAREVLSLVNFISVRGALVTSSSEPLLSYSRINASVAIKTWQQIGIAGRARRRGG
jgi:hypothetical protein